MRAHGIDISKWAVDWNLPDNPPHPIDFVIQRVSWAGNVDERYQNHSKKVNKCGIRGAYHYYSSGVPWRDQADLFLRLITNNPDTTYHMAWLDYETGYNNLSRRTSEEAQKIVEYVSSRFDGIFGVYANLNTTITYLDKFGDWMLKWPFWLAYYLRRPAPNKTPGWKIGTVKLKRPEGDWQFWQYTKRGKAVDYGLVGKEAVDLDVFNGTVEELRIYLGIVSTVEVKMKIPYRSQEDSDAQIATTDCGAASLSMVLEAFGFKVDIDVIFESTGREPNEFLSRSDLIKAAKEYDVPLKKFGDGNFPKIKSAVDQNHPMIALVNYAAWSKEGSGVPTQSDFDKTHFVVIVGYDLNGNVIIHDPLFWGSRRHEGKFKKMTFDQFNAAWSTCHEFRDNPDNVGIISEISLTDTIIIIEPEVTKEEIRLIRAWAEFNGVSVELDAILKREVADVYLHHMGNWGAKVVNHKVVDGEDLGLLALRYYGDPLKWKVITLFNDLPPVNAFKVGDVLKIPEPINE